MIEIFSHDVSFGPDEDESEVFVISGRGWEGEPFKLFLTYEDCQNLIWQMTYYISNPEYE